MSASTLLASAAGDDRELRGPADHRQQHRQREHAPATRARRAELATGGGQYTGAGFFGKGVNVATVTRAHSDFLTREAATTRAVARRRRGAQRPAAALETVFPTGEAGLGYAAQQLFNAFVDVANKPQDASARQVVLARIGDLAARFRTAGDQIDTIQAGRRARTCKTAVTSVNTLTQRIADLNRQIANVKGTGHEPERPARPARQRDQRPEPVSSR